MLHPGPRERIIRQHRDGIAGFHSLGDWTRAHVQQRAPGHDRGVGRRRRLGRRRDTERGCECPNEVALETVHAARDASRVVVGDVLLGRTGHGVVVLRDGHGLGERPERALPRHRAVSAGVLKADDRREGLGGSKKFAAAANESLQRRPAREVPGPVLVRGPSVREEVPALQGPTHVGVPAFGVQVRRRCAVEDVHAPALRRVDVTNEPVYLLVPVGRRAVGKVRPHRQHHVPAVRGGPVRT